MKTVIDFLKDDQGQDFAEYALILGAIAVVALAVLSSYKTELTNAFNRAIAALASGLQLMKAQRNQKRPAGTQSHGSANPQKGQALAEFALTVPVIILLLFGMTLAGLYAFRAAAADWGVFITGVAAGAYQVPATGQVQDSIVGAAVRVGLTTHAQPADRQVRAQIDINTACPWVFGLNLAETQRGTTAFRLWRFYSGPPAPGGVE